jgi:hypothetical protein
MRNLAKSKVREGEAMKDVTTRSFGLLIAYLLPGLACFCCVALFSSEFKGLLSSFITSESNMGSFFFVLVLSLLFGLILNALRWFIYEKCFPLGSELPPECFLKLGEANRVLAIHNTIDENLRYHQFYASVSLVLPIFIVTIAFKVFTYLPKDLGLCQRFGVVVILLVLLGFLEIVTIFAAREAFCRYVTRSKAVME